MATTYIKLRHPYLKEYILNLTDVDGNRVYTEPVYFAKDTAIGRIINNMRRVPNLSYKPVESQITDENRKQYLQIELPVNPAIRGDERRIYLSESVQTRISKAIYEDFFTFAFHFVEEHLIWQKQVFPGNEPVKRRAYLDLIDYCGLVSADEDSIRRAFDRKAKLSTYEKSKKIFASKKNFRPFFAQ